MLVSHDEDEDENEVEVEDDEGERGVMIGGSLVPDVEERRGRG